MSIVQFNFPTRIMFGAGAVATVGGELKAQGKKRPLIVTDEGVAALPFLTELAENLQGAGLETAVFPGVKGNPVKSQVVAGVAAYHEHGADALVLVGGGAALDVGKTIALMAHHPGDVFDYEDGKPDGLPVDQEIPFMIAVPTTSGTGSEVGRSSVISDDETHVKRIVFSPRLLAPVVIADPALTTGLPAGITAATGLDALSHNVEAYLSKGFHPMCDGIALEGIRLVAENLEQCVREPGDLEARGNMMMASTMGAVAFQKGLGVVHSCAHALSAVCDMHHGLANALMLPACMRFNGDAVPERFERMAAVAGLAAGDAVEEFAAWIEALNASLGLPKSLGEAGVAPEQVPPLTDIALADVCHPCNPRDVARTDFERLFHEAM